MSENMGSTRVTLPTLSRTNKDP